MKRVWMMKMLSLWGPPVLWASYIFKLSSGQIGAVSQVYWYEFTIKSLAHIIFYSILTVLVARALKGSGYKRKKSLYYSLYISIFYAFFDEIHQSFVPGRDARLHDVFFDTIGSALAAYFLWKLLPKAPKKLKDLAESWQLI